jgi:penicillin-binding protein 1C
MRRWLKRTVGAVGAGLGLALGAVLVFVALPLPAGLLDYRPIASVRVTDRDGGLLRELLSRDDGRAVPLKAEEVPAHVRAAFVAAEDRGFHGHLGVSPSSILRALWQNVRAGRVVAGGSTLTQQLARNLVPRPRTFRGKVQEALWALRLEAHLSKEELLTQYLNRVPFGNGAFGLEAASQMYFGRSARHLSLAQAAALAAVPRGPSTYNPYRRMASLQKRQAWILRRMAELGLADKAEAERATSEQLDLQAFTSSFRAPHLVAFVRANLERWGLGEATVVETTLDPRLQPEVEGVISQELARLGERRVGSAAALVVDNATGEVLAYEGSADFFNDEIQGQNDGVQMKRQPGSALKPFVYVEAFRAGYSPASVLPDLDTRLPSGQGVYAPKNYDRRSHGPVRLREALANSYNVPAVRLADELGTARVVDGLRRAGFTSLQREAGYYGLGVVLGNGEVSLWEAARAYAGLARGGTVRPLRIIRRALRADGTELPLPEELKPRRFADATSVALVTSILGDPAARARAFGLDNALRLPFPVAAKTGTSKGYSDNWTVGYTRERTVAVWAGNFDGTPMVHVSGITGAGPIFKRVMTKAMANVTPAPLVDEDRLEHARICPLSGERAGTWCPAAMDEVFAPGKTPAHDCAMHRGLASELPRDLVRRCKALADARGRVVDLGQEYHAWQRAEGLEEEPWLASVCSGEGRPREGQGEALAKAGAEPRIVYPLEHDEFLLFPDLPLKDQAIPLRVNAGAREGPLEVRLDGETLFTLRAPYAGRIPATQGEHVLSLHRPGAGAAAAEVRFRVRSEQRVW